MTDSTVQPNLAVPAPFIRNIVSDGVLGEFGYSVSFDALNAPRGRVKVIYAENGMGKTNFLKAVHHLLNPRLEGLQALAEIFVNDLSITLNSGVTVSLGRSENLDALYFCSIEYPNNEARTVVDITQEDIDARASRAPIVRPRLRSYLEELATLVSPTIFIGDDRVVHASADWPSTRSRRATLPDREAARARGRAVQSVRDVLDNVERYLTRTALAGISRDTNLASDGVYVDITRRVLAGNNTTSLAAEARASLAEQAANLLSNADDFEKYGLMSFVQVRRINSEVTMARANNRHFTALQGILGPYLTNIADGVRSMEPARLLIDTFVTSVNSFLERKELIFSAADGIRLVGKTGEELEPDNLSSGEKHLLLLLSNAVLARPTNSLLIIDEPELSLGLRWQRQLLPELLRCTEGSGVQFLVASHSVQVMGEIDQVIRPTEVA